MTSSRPVIVVTGRHRPHEQLFLAWSALIGASYLVAWAPPPASLAALLPRPVFLLWVVAMVVSGVTGLVGCWWRGERGLGLELGGLLMNAGALSLYAFAVFATAGTRALLPGGLVLAWALANLWRSAQAFRDLKSIRGTGSA